MFQEILGSLCLASTRLARDDARLVEALVYHGLEGLDSHPKHVGADRGFFIQRVSGFVRAVINIQRLARVVGER
jgi:hypothetical protein